MLKKSKLKKVLLKYFKEYRNNPNEAADELAEIIDDYIKTALVKSEGTLIIPSNTIVVSGPSGVSTNVQPIVLNNIKNKGKLH